VLVHSEGALGLVEDALARGTVNLAVLGAAELVGELLASRFLGIGLDTTGKGVSWKNRGCSGRAKESEHTERACHQYR